MTRPVRVLLAAVGLEGHLFPILGLARALADRGNEVWVDAPERWGDLVREQGFGYVRDREDPADRRDPKAPSSVPAAARRAAKRIAAVDPEVVVCDGVTAPQRLAAEMLGLPRVTVLHHAFPLVPPGRPPFPAGLLPPRTPVGAALWRLTQPGLNPGLRLGRRRLNAQRRELGLPATDRPFGAIGDGLTLVATFPQLEYPREWPADVHVTGPFGFQPPREPVEPPPGDDPLVVVIASSGQDPNLTLLRVSLTALAAEPLRILGSTSGKEASFGDLPPTAKVERWLSLAHVLESASLVITRGGHGTVAAALSAGRPLLICAVGADQPETAIRVSWAGAGLSLPRRLLKGPALRATVRTLLADPAYRERAEELAAWSRRHDGAVRGAELVEAYARR